jgi:hypothetical protein
MSKASFTNVSNKEDRKWKRTSDRRLPQISKLKYLCNDWPDLPQSLNLGLYDQSKLYKCFKWRRPQLEDNLNWKITSNIKSGISQQLLVGSFQFFLLKRVWPKQNVSNGDDLQWKRTSNGILPQISKVKYLSNNWSDLPQILNLGLCNQSKLYKCVKWMCKMEEDLR